MWAPCEQRSLQLLVGTFDGDKSLWLSFAIILCACDFNYIRRCDSQPICDTNRACFSSGDFSLAAFSELFGPGQVCYWKTWFSGSNSPCSSASILDHRLLWSIDFFGF
jgi:hypothetical protein